MAAPASGSKSAMAAEEKKWRADSDLRTLIEAEKIKKDPERFKAAMKMHKEQLAALASIQKDKG